MTREEKAEEYFGRHQYAKDNRNGKQITIHKLIYLDGLAEGKPKSLKSDCPTVVQDASNTSSRICFGEPMGDLSARRIS